MTWIPSEPELEIAEALHGRLIARGAAPGLEADGRLRVNGKATPGESSWVRAHQAAFRAALVGRGRYVRGTLDRIYEIESEGGRSG